jgi:hypothetical protein
VATPGDKPIRFRIAEGLARAGLPMVQSLCVVMAVLLLAAFSRIGLSKF